jgi:hypothetical protein
MVKPCLRLEPGRHHSFVPDDFRADFPMRIKFHTIAGRGTTAWVERCHNGIVEWWLYDPKSFPDSFLTFSTFPDIMDTC